MRRRGFELDHPGAWSSERPLPPRLGEPSAHTAHRIGRPILRRSAVNGTRLQTRDLSRLLDPEIQIFEDEQAQDAAAIAYDDDIEPRESIGREILQPSQSVNLMGVDYGEDADAAEPDAVFNDEENYGTVGEPGIEKAVDQQSGILDEPVSEVLIDQEMRDCFTEQDPPCSPALEQLKEPQHALEPTPEVERVADGPSEVSKSGKLVDDFHLALMLFVTASDLSTSQYQALTEVLALATPSGISSLPRSIKTLRENCRKTFPLAHIKARRIALSSSATPPKTETPKSAYYFEPSEYSRLWLNDPKLQLHLGLGVIVDSPTELWHGDAWLESVRTTSGEFARIGGGEILLPSDCISFRDSEGNIALGRVKGVGVDSRSGVAFPNNAKSYSAIVNRLLPVNELPQHVSHLSQDVPGNAHPQYESALPELILFDTRDVVPCSDIISKEWVYFTDYESPDMLSASLLPQNPMFCVRRIVYLGSTGILCTRSVHQRHRVIAELELITLTRDYVLSNLVNGCQPTLNSVLTNSVLTEGTRRVSLPYSVFLDGFGLYRNAYHSLKGMYITPAGLDVDSRTQLGNMFVLMIGPFGSSEQGMAECLAEDSNRIGGGYVLRLEEPDKETGEEKVVIATTFPIMFTGDMPQQNQNSGNKTHNAQFGCRSCFIPHFQRGNLMFDTVASGRYRTPVKRIYDEAMGLVSRSARTDTLRKYGLTAEGPYFARCYPMLDPQRANPNDPMHAELRLAKYFAETLVDGILSPTGINAYRAVWDYVDVPFGWGQPQNPVNHKGSMVFSEHGQIAIMQPFVILHMLTDCESKFSREEKSHFKAAVESRMIQAFGTLDAARMNIIRTAFLMAKTIHLTLKRSLTTAEQREFHSTVIEERILMRKFFQSTGGTTRGNYEKYADVPNVHLGLHYAQDMQNFSTTYNASTMLGEQKHKILKQHAAHTNSKDSDFQLMKAINTSQTIRFLLNGAYGKSASASGISNQVREVVDRCPILKVRFLGRVMAEEEEDTCTEDPVGAVDTANSLLKSAKTGRPIALTAIQANIRESDMILLREYYKTVFDITLVQGMRYKIRYWGYMSGQTCAKSYYEGHHKFRVAVTEFIRLKDDTLTFYRLHRIITLSFGTFVTVFLVLEKLQRDMGLEEDAAPYPIYVDTDEILIADIRKLDPTILHFVKRGKDSWWWNPFVPQFT